MNTFLPYRDFSECARVLDSKRLGKQRVECLQILNILIGSNPNASWRNHPAVIMWRGFEIPLYEYSSAICREWISRGYKDTVLDKLNLLIKNSNLLQNAIACGRIHGTNKMILYFSDIPSKEILIKDPPWLGDDDLHASHRSNLMRKDLRFYRQYGWMEPVDMPYLWVSKSEKYMHLYVKKDAVKVSVEEIKEHGTP